MVAAYMAVILIPPYSFGLLAILAAGCWYARRHVLVWVAVPFLVVHAVVAHKEPRFLIPLLYLVGPLCAVCVDALPRGLSAPLRSRLPSRWGRANVALWSAVNALLLSVAVVAPVKKAYPLDRWLWDEGRKGQMTVYTIGRPPDHHSVSGRETKSFYSSAKVVLTPFEAIDRGGASLGREPTWVYYLGGDVPAAVTASGTCEPVARTLPVWLEALIDHVRWLNLDPEQATICRLDNGRRQPQ